VTDALGNVTTYHFDPNGNLLDVTDPTGATRVFTLNVQQNNLVSSIRGGGSCPSCGNPRLGDLTFTYDANGNLATRTDSLGNTTTTTYDPVFNHVLSSTDPLSNVTSFTYDAHGNQITRTDANGNTSSFTHNSYGLLTAFKDALGRKTAFSYDGVGDLIAITDPLGNTNSFGYDAVSRRVQFLDPLGRKNATSYDALDRVVTTTNTQGNQAQFTYDQVSNQLSATDENGQTTSYVFDAMSRLTTRTDPRGKSDTRSYDLNGNLIQFVDRRGQKSTFTYDALNRSTGQSFQDGSAFTGSYDANGRVVQVSDSAGGTFDYTYDSTGRQVSLADQFGTVQYAYDAAGRVLSRQVAGQTAVTYSYDAASNLLIASLPQAAANFTYDAQNELLTISRPDRVSSQYTYDSAGRALSVIHQGGQGIQLPFTYSYDAAGDRTLYTTSFTGPQAAVNVFDAWGRLTQSGATSYTYDDNGNVTSASGSSGTTTYAWDTRNRLQSISASSGQQTVFTYDFATNLLAQTDSGPALNLKQSFVLDRTNVAYIGRSNGDNLSVLAGRIVDQHLAVVHASGQVEYGLADGINSTVATVDQAGDTVSSFSYAPFGKTTSSSTYPFQFTGRVPVNGSLYYYRARYYDSVMGRFASEDPRGPFRGGSAYVYAGDSPEVHSDPTGLDFKSCFSNLVGDPYATAAILAGSAGAGALAGLAIIGGAAAGVGIAVGVFSYLGTGAVLCAILKPTPPAPPTCSSPGEVNTNCSNGTCLSVGPITVH
jgi:RHS repeat-associated protein